jgi:ketosteroid isomerase-like protein
MTERSGAVDQGQADSAAQGILGRLERAFQERDLESLVGCFQEDVVIDYPAHPAQRYEGRDQIWRIWAPVFAGIADFKATVLRSAVVGDVLWAEWLWQGTQRDGSPGDMAGVVVHGVEGDMIAWARFYMEPVEK